MSIEVTRFIDALMNNDIDYQLFITQSNVLNYSDVYENCAKVSPDNKKEFLDAFLKDNMEKLLHSHYNCFPNGDKVGYRYQSGNFTYYF
jgi:hypothetical protein